MSSLTWWSKDMHRLGLRWSHSGTIEYAVRRNSRGMMIRTEVRIISGMICASHNDCCLFRNGVVGKSDSKIGDTAGWSWLFSGICSRRTSISRNVLSEGRVSKCLIHDGAIHPSEEFHAVACRAVYRELVKSGPGVSARASGDRGTNMQVQCLEWDGG